METETLGMNEREFGHEDSGLSISVAGSKAPSQQSCSSREEKDCSRRASPLLKSENCRVSGAFWLSHPSTDLELDWDG